MATFAPRAVDPGNLKIWMREALALTTRRLAANVTLGLLLVGIGLLPGSFGTYLTLFLCPLWLMAFCWLAEAADNYRPYSEILTAEQLGELWRRVLPLFGMFITYQALVQAFGWMMAKMAETLAPHMPMAAQASHTVKAAVANPWIYEALLNTNSALGCGLIVQHAYGLALAAPLVIFQGLGYPEASALSRKAHSKNWLPLFGATLFLCLVTVMLANVLGGVLTIALLPFSAALFYAAYRDIFLGRMENKPKPAMAAERLVQAASG